MRSALECFHQAAKCEQMARDARDDKSRTVLEATSRHWRGLGEKAKASECKSADSITWPEKKAL